MLDPSQKSHQGHLPKDRKGNAIQTAGGIRTTNGTKLSPLAITTSIDSIVIPASFVELILSPSVAMDISEDPLFGSYYTLQANSVYPIGVGGTNVLYIRGSGNGTLNFFFNTLTLLPATP